jgi:hypothetical protein
VPKSKNHCGANDLSVTVISNRKCYEKCVLFAPQWFFYFGRAFMEFVMNFSAFHYANEHFAKNYSVNVCFHY